MTTRKISLTLDEDLLAEVRAEVGPRRVSAFVNDAIRFRLEAEGARHRMLRLLDELDAADPSTEEEKALGEQWAKAILAEVDR